MADKKKKFYPSMRTPKGLAQWAALMKPKKKYNSEDEEYTVKLRFEEDSKEWKTFKDSLDNLLLTHIKENEDDIRKELKVKAGKPLPDPNEWYREYDEDDDSDYAVPKGMVEITIKSPSHTAKGEARVIKVIDAKLNQIKDKSLQVGNDSVLKVQFNPNPYATKIAGIGLSLRLEAVQIIKLEEYGASKLLFDEEEDGFDMEEESFTNAIDEMESEDINSDDDEELTDGDF